MRFDHRSIRRAVQFILLSPIASASALAGPGGGGNPGEPTYIFRYPPPREPRSVPNEVMLVDSDHDGRAEAVRVRLRVNVDSAGVWVIALPRLVPADRDSDSTMVIGGPVGTFPIEYRGPHDRFVRFPADRPGPVDVVIEFDAEEFRYFLGSRPSRLDFGVNLMSASGETSRIDGPLYRSSLAAIPIRKLGWLPARLLQVEPALTEGRVGFRVRLEADRDTTCTLTLRAGMHTRRAWADSTVQVTLRAGVSTQDLVLNTPPAFTHASLDSLELSIMVEPRPAFFPGGLWAHHIPMPAR